jgi:hypothetical protein
MPRIAKPFDEAALRRACAEFGSLAEARQSGLSRQNLLTVQSPLTVPLGGESHAVAFPIRRRFLQPELPVSEEAEEPSCAVAGLR